MEYKIQRYPSPIGELYLVEKSLKLCAIIFKCNWSRFREKLLKQKGSVIHEEKTPVLKATIRQLNEYFQGKRRSFDLPCELNGTEFQTRVWKSLQKIPFGETRSYKQQAESINSPLAVRAAGRANGLNPICIIFPCHRVIGSNGTLTGFAGGLKAKKFLLELEGAIT